MQMISDFMRFDTIVLRQKNMIWKVDGYNIRSVYIAPGQRQIAPRGQNFDVNRKALPLYPFAASFKEISLKSDFICDWFTCQSIATVSIMVHGKLKILR